MHDKVKRPVETMLNALLRHFPRVSMAIEATQEIFSKRPVGHADKVQNFEQAAQTVRDWKDKGYKVGFTNGCYDLLHSGHLFSIAQTRQHCDKLIVGVNTDASVSKLKGPSRPVQNEQIRAEVLASLRDVDLVVVFGQDTPHELISRLLPDVLVKGKDYLGKLVVGRDVVEANGGRVVLTDMIPGVSTTNTIARMNKRNDGDTSSVRHEAG